MARPLKPINWDVVERLMENGSTGVEIAGKFRILPDTLYRRFKEEYGCNFQCYQVESHEGGKAELRAMLWAKAINNKAPGNAQLLLFLARCVLGLREPEITNLLAANQEQIDQSHEIMRLQHKIAELEEANANKS